MPQLLHPLPLAVLAAISAMASPVLQERQRGESPCFTFPGDRCPPATYCDSSLAPTDAGACRSLIANLNGMAGDLCVSGNACRFWTSGDACRVGICNNDSDGVCDSATQFATWATEGFDQCEPSGFTLIPDRPQWFEVYVTTPLPQQEGASVASVQSSAVVEGTMPVDQFKAELDEIRAMNNAQGATKRQAEGDNDFDVTVFNFGTRMDGGSEVVSNILQDGGEFATSESETYTFGVSASVEVGGTFFEVMTVGAGISVDTSTSYTNSKTETVPIDCPGACGIVEYFHLYDCYEGNFVPSGQPGEFCVPIDQGQYAVRCVGC